MEIQSNYSKSPLHLHAHLALSIPQFTAGYLNKYMEEAAPTKG